MSGNDYPYDDCPRCDGSGIGVGLYGVEDCGYCGGSGEIEVEERARRRARRLAVDRGQKP